MTLDPRPEALAARFVQHTGLMVSVRSPECSELRVDLDVRPTTTGRFSDRPLLVFWEMTTACALACAHCRANAQVAGTSDELTSEQGVALIDELAALGAPRPILILTGGDCLVRSDLYALVAHARDVGVPVAIAPSVTPRLNNNSLTRLSALGIKTASISLDGSCRETHDAIRGVDGHFSETLRAVTLLRDHGIKVQVNTAVMMRNVEELADVAALTVRLGVSFWELFFLISTGRGSQLGALSSEENEDVCHFLVDASRYGVTVRTVEAPFFRRVLAQRAAIGEAATEAHFSLGPLYYRLRDRLEALLGAAQSSVRAPSVATRDGKGIVFVARNGDIYPSGFLPLRVGNVLIEGLINTYRNSPVMLKLRLGQFDGACAQCDYRELCGGSRARAFSVDANPFGADPGCLRCAVFDSSARDVEVSSLRLP